MLTLNDFPLVKKAFAEIESDTSGTYACKIMGKAVVSEKYIEHFRRANSALFVVYKQRLGSLNLSTRQWKVLRDNIGATKNTSAFGAVVCPCDSNDRLVLRAAGVPEPSIMSLTKVLNDFFDGDLHGIFAKEEK